MLINHNKYIALVRWLNNEFTISCSKELEEKSRSILGKERSMAQKVMKPTAVMTNYRERGLLNNDQPIQHFVYQGRS